MLSQNAPLKVLVVDDSAFMRKAISTMLNKSSEINVVGVARDGQEALKKIAELHPDVVTMDIEMPVMNGLQALEQIMKTHPVPVIMISTLTEQGAVETLRALELGAVDFLPKELHGSVLNISHIEEQLLVKVKAAANAVGKIRIPSAQKTITTSRPTASSPITSRSLTNEAPTSLKGGNRRNPKSARPVEGSIVVIGSSTGGPKALQDVLPSLPGSLSAGVVIAQHMPKFFTKPFAERLNQLCALEVREATERDVVEPGVVLIAPGGQHLSLEYKGQGRVGLRISPEPSHLPYRPSVDVLMESAAEIYGQHCLGVVLTGMGNDGLLGMKAIKAEHGRTIAQDEATCIVYGMPKAVFEGGCADKVVPITRVADEIVNGLREMASHRSSRSVHDQAIGQTKDMAITTK